MHKINPLHIHIINPLHHIKETNQNKGKICYSSKLKRAIRVPAYQSFIKLPYLKEKVILKNIGTLTNLLWLQ